MADYDVIVLGGGSPGEHCAGALAEGGLRVAVAERRLVGGECSYYACIPSKTLLRPGEAVRGAVEAGANAQIDVQAALAYRDYMVSGYKDDGQLRWLADERIDLLRGTGRLAGPGAVEVDGVRHTAAHVVVATGSEPFIPPVPGLAGLDGVWTNREATAMTEVPKHLLVIGAGPVGVELAQVVLSFGGAVTVIEGGPRVLSAEPPRLGDALAEVLRRDGADLVLGARVTAAARDGAGYVLTLGDGRELRGDRILVATGRRIRLPDGLDTVGVTPGPRGAIPVDARLRVTKAQGAADGQGTADGLWAVGDATGLWLLTHVGKYQGEVVAANILGEPREANYEAVPRVVYTYPQAASVGEHDAPYSGTAALSGVAKTATYSHAYADSNGFLTLLSDGTRLTGAYALGPEAGEWLQQAVLAVRARVPVAVLRDTIQPFPAFTEIFVDALKALHADIKAGRPAGKAGRPGEQAAR